MSDKTTRGVAVPVWVPRDGARVQVRHASDFAPLRREDGLHEGTAYLGTEADIEDRIVAALAANGGVTIHMRNAVMAALRGVQ